MDTGRDGNVIAEIRKLRKKLRQIENLERLDRPLNFEESEKVARKGAIRSLLQEKSTLVSEGISTTPETSTATPENLEELPETPRQSPSKQTSPEPSGSQQALGEDGGEEMKRTHDQSENSPRGQAGKGSQEQAVGGAAVQGVGVKRPREIASGSGSGSGDAKSTQSQAAVPAAKGKKDTSQKIAQRGKTDVERRREEWRRLRLSVQDLEAHHDLISSVDCKDNIVVSGSRDTTVRAWDRSTGHELCSLGGHSGGVTAVYLLSAAESSAVAPHYDVDSASCHLALSSSIDCSVRLWDLDASKELRSIYTFSAVTAMAYLSTEQCVVTGSDGGKVELWDVTTGESVFSSLTHAGGVTCIQVKGQKVASASADGVIKLWEVRERSLHVIFESENIHSQSGVLVQRPITSLGLASDDIYYGDDGTNIKILDWKTGTVRKLRNHLGDFGSTDAMFLGNDILMFSSYDLDNGIGSINVFSASTNQYIATICDPDTSRIEAISAPSAANSAQCFVTAGRELRLWKILPRNQHSSGDDLVEPTFEPPLTMPPEDSEDESSDSEASGDEVFAAVASGGLSRGSHRRSRRRGSSSSEPQAPSSWLSWCTLI